MPSRPRKHQLEGDLVYHLWNRGNRKYEIFHEDEDYELFRSILGGYVADEGLLIYHYGLMPNHYHLEAEIENNERMSSVMGGINRSYTHYYHKKYGTSGFLWQGRFGSKPIQKSEYLLSCARYIETNSVRAKLVEKPEQYAYSSARYYALGEKDALIFEDPSYKEFGATVEEMRYNYCRFLADPKETEEEAKKYGFCDFSKPLGDKDFVAKLWSRNGRKYPRRQGRVRN